MHSKHVPSSIFIFWLERPTLPWQIIETLKEHSFNISSACWLFFSHKASKSGLLRCFIPEIGNWCLFYSIFQRRQWHPTPVPLPGKSHGWRSLVGCSPWGREESDMTEWLHFHFSLSCIGEGNGNPLQCLAWRIPRTAEPDGLPSMGSHRVRHYWSDLAAAAAVTVY